MSSFKNIDFKGVYDAANIPTLKHNQYCIFNNKTYSQGGEHWISICKLKEDYFVYDSFGRKTKEYMNNNYKTHMNKWIQTDDNPEQNIIQTNCGARCISWIITCNKFGIKTVKDII